MRGESDRIEGVEDGDGGDSHRALWMLDLVSDRRRVLTQHVGAQPAEHAHRRRAHSVECVLDGVEEMRVDRVLGEVLWRQLAERLYDRCSDRPLGVTQRLEKPWRVLLQVGRVEAHEGGDGGSTDGEDLVI